MQERERIGLGLVLITMASLPVLFFLVVVHSLILAGAALVVELGLFTSVRIALARPRRPVGIEALRAQGWPDRAHPSR